MTFLCTYRTVIVTLLLQFTIGFLLYLGDDGSVAGIGGYPLTVTRLWWVYCMLFWGNLFTVVRTWKEQQSAKSKLLSTLLSGGTFLMAATSLYGGVASMVYQLRYLGKLSLQKSILLGIAIWGLVFLASGVSESVLKKNHKEISPVEQNLSTEDSIFVSNLFMAIMSSQKGVTLEDHTRFQSLLEKSPNKLKKPDVEEASRMQLAIYSDLYTSLISGVLTESPERKGLETASEHSRNNEFIAQVMRGDTISASNGLRYYLTKESVATILSGLETAMVDRGKALDSLYNSSTFK